MRRIFDWLRSAYAERETRRQLYALSDHMLRDIGLRRDEIPAVLVERSSTPPRPGPLALAARLRQSSS
jgi:uncharacterized protein YjiS (DUF1127 family)